MNNIILMGHAEAKGGVRDASSVLSPASHSRVADLTLFLVIQTHSSR